MTPCERCGNHPDARELRHLSIEGHDYRLCESCEGIVTRRLHRSPTPGGLRRYGRHNNRRNGA